MQVQYLMRKEGTMWVFAGDAESPESCPVPDRVQANNVNYYLLRTDDLSVVPFLAYADAGPARLELYAVRKGEGLTHLRTIEVSLERGLDVDEMAAPTTSYIANGVLVYTGLVYGSPRGLQRSYDIVTGEILGTAEFAMPGVDKVYGMYFNAAPVEDCHGEIEGVLDKLTERLSAKEMQRITDAWEATAAVAYAARDPAVQLAFMKATKEAYSALLRGAKTA